VHALRLADRLEAVPRYFVSGYMSSKEYSKEPEYLAAVHALRHFDRLEAVPRYFGLEDTARVEALGHSHSEQPTHLRQLIRQRLRRFALPLLPFRCCCGRRVSIDEGLFRCISRHAHNEAVGVPCLAAALAAAGDAGGW
jgi:hypothetical protein